MKRIILATFMCLACLFLGNSCTKEDYADDYVGIYNVGLVQNVTWGNSSGTVTDSGVMRITKESRNRVKLEGFISTEGVVTGNSIQLESTTLTDSYGTITTVYGPGLLTGDMLTLSATSTGRLKNNGVFYPFSSFDRFTCVKQ